MLNAVEILTIKSQLQVIIPHMQGIQSSAYAAHENIIAAFASKALSALYQIELDLDKPKPFTQAEWIHAKEEVDKIE